MDIVVSDVFDLHKKIPEHSVDRIITDPPWGIFDRDYDDYYKFYTQVFEQFLLLVKKKARIVLLTAKKQEVEKICAKNRSVLQITNKYHILVSGKKAAIFVIQVRT